jgi:O-antigen/teichoic acid export membrane protein
MTDLLASLRRNEMARNVMTLMTGSAFSLAIPVLISPVLTRLYEPREFGAFTVFMACCSLVGVFATARYDLAILEPREEEEGRNVLRLCVCLAVGYTVVVALASIAVYRLFQPIVEREGIGLWTFCIPFCVFTLTCYSIFAYWLNRQKDFKGMSLNRVLNNGTNAVVSVVCGYLGWSSGLFIGFVVGQVLAIGVVWGKVAVYFRTIDSRALLATASKYRRYPKFLLPATLAGEVANHVPMLMLTWGFGAPAAGFLALANRAAAAPLALFGNAIGEVYRQRAFEEHHRHGNCRRLYLRTLGLLALVGAVPALALLCFGPWLFTVAFGGEWTTAGEVAAAIAPMVFFNFTSTPLSYTIALNQSQRADMILQILRMVFAIAAIGVGWMAADYMLGITLYSAAYSLYYVAHSVIQYRASL